MTQTLLETNKPAWSYLQHTKGGGGRQNKIKKWAKSSARVESTQFGLLPFTQVFNLNSKTSNKGESRGCVYLCNVTIRLTRRVVALVYRQAR